MVHMTKITMVCLLSVGLTGWVGGCGKKSETTPPAKPAESTDITAPVSPPAEPAKPNKMAVPAPAPAPAPATTQAKTDTPLAPEPGTQVVTLAITGMHCDDCAQAIRQKLGEVKGVRMAHASFPAKTAWVMIDKAGGPGVEQLVKAVEAAGYKAAPAVSAGPSSAPH